MSRLVTAKEAAEIAEVPLNTFRSWVRRGLVHPATVTRRLPNGQHASLYDVLRVLEVERQTRLADPKQQRARQQLPTPDGG